MPKKPRVLKPDSDDEYFFSEGCHILELSNTPHDPAVSIARARAGPGQVETGGQPPVDVSPGDVVLIPPGCPQRIRNTGSEDLVFLAICSPRFTVSAYEDLGE